MQTSSRTRPGSLVDICPKCGHALPTSHGGRKPKVADEDIKANVILATVGGFFVFCVVMGFGFNVWLSTAAFMIAGLLVFTKQDIAEAEQRSRRG